MNAVNLIPAGSRKRRAPLTTSRPTLALIAGLVGVLIATVLYVTASNNVKTRQGELTHVTATAASWRAVAGSYQRFVQAAQQRTQELADVRQLAADRYPWEQLLSQVAGLLPATAALTSLQATTAPAAGSSATPGSSASTTPGSSASTTPGSSASTSAATSSAALPLPAVQLSGCAASQDSVAQTMVQLHRVHGVAAVTLSSATESGSSGAASSGASSGTGGGCPFPVQFQVSLTFAAPAAAGTASSGSVAPGTGSTGAPSTPATTGSGATPTAAVATNSTGANAR
jgi:Tfp pilus assembly protein PilN